MATQGLAILDGADLPVCPDCRRSVWEVVRQKLGVNGERTVDVRCADCGLERTVVREAAKPNWTMMSHRA